MSDKEPKNSEVQDETIPMPEPEKPISDEEVKKLVNKKAWRKFIKDYEQGKE